jgi:hypothetical protein
MSTLQQLRLNVRANLIDAGITYYSDSDINTALQNAYDYIVAKALCNVKNVTLNWTANQNYFDFTASPFSLTDYIGVHAILNNNTKWYLRDDVSRRDLDRIRRDWELWTGQPQFWCPHSLKYAIIVPQLTAAVGTFQLWYYAQAPTFSGDSDSPIIAPDVHPDIESRATADMLESAEEITKAQYWWDQFWPDFNEYKARCENQAKDDLLLRV